MTLASMPVLVYLSFIAEASSLTLRIVLGCTHYTFLVPALAPLVAGRAQLVDVAEAVARQCRRLAGTAENSQGRLILQATAHPERLQAALPALGLAQLLPRLQEAAAQIDI